jgi:hypothetical protein
MSGPLFALQAHLTTVKWRATDDVFGRVYLFYPPTNPAQINPLIFFYDRSGKQKEKGYRQK